MKKDNDIMNYKIPFPAVFLAKLNSKLHINFYDSGTEKINVRKEKL